MENSSHRLTTLLSTFAPHRVDTFVAYKFTPEHFEIPDSEEYLTIHRGIEGCIAQYGDLLEFWIHSLYSYCEDEGMSTTFASLAGRSLCHAMPTSTADSLLARFLNQVKATAEVRPESNFAGAMQMFDDWNFIAVVGRTPERFFTFYWETTA
jgi:hypothetical protein